MSLDIYTFFCLADVFKTFILTSSLFIVRCGGLTALSNTDRSLSNNQIERFVLKHSENVERTFHLQTFRKCYFRMFSVHSKTSSNISNKLYTNI